MSPNGEIEVIANVENTGEREGSQVVQFYLQDVTASVSRPVKELIGFESITLKQI